MSCIFSGKSALATTLAFALSTAHCAATTNSQSTTVVHPVEQDSSSDAQPQTELDSSLPILDAELPSDHVDSAVVDVVTTSPISGDLPTLTIDGLHALHAQECSRNPCIIGAPPLNVDVLSPRWGNQNPPAYPGWIHILRRGSRLAFPRDQNMDLLGVVLVGQVGVQLTELPRTSTREFTAWNAFHIPQIGVNIRPTNGDAAIVLIRAGTPSSPREVVSLPQRRANTGILSQNISSLEDLAWANNSFHARIAFQAPQSQRASLEVLIGSPDAPVPEHQHPDSAELLIALSGEGRLHIPAQTLNSESINEQDIAVHSGSVVWVPVAVRHQWIPDGTTPLIAVQSYSPPGQEQRFRTLAHPNQ